MKLLRCLILLPLVVVAYAAKTAPLPNVIVSLEVPAAYSAPAFSEKELTCVRDMVYGEARGEPFLGQAAVAAVAIRRSIEAHWPYDLCAVVQQHNQFHGYKKFKDSAQLRKTMRSVEYALNNMDEFPEALFFHRKDMGRSYANQYVVGNHLFYTRGNL